MFDHVIRIAYFEPDQSSLIATACAILTDRCAESSARGFLRSHWARGPHLDCVLTTDDTDREAAILDEVASAIMAWIERHPSTTMLPADFADRSRRMADAEQWTGPVSPLYRNNSVVCIANDKTSLWGSNQLWIVAALFHCDVLSVVSDLVAERRRSRGTFVLTIARHLAAVGRIASPDQFDFWPLSFSAHARLFLTAHPSLRSTFEEAWLRLRPQAVQALGDVIDADADPDDLALWLAGCNALDARIRELQADPAAALVPIDVNNPLHIQDTLGSYEQVSSHLHAMFDADRLSAVFSSPAHLRFRIIVNIAYESLACATVSPVERALACYLLSRTVIERFPDKAAAASERVSALAVSRHD